YLQDKEILLVLDNLEHLLEERSRGGAIGDFLAQLLLEAPHVKLLITSREPISLQGEWLYGVEGLAYPDSQTQTPAIEDFDAITLFVQRARQISPGFSLEAQNRAGVAQVCTLVEGMPLAIELAATWVRALSPAEIAAEIQRDLDFLWTQMRDLPERHRSIRAIFDRTWQSLPADEKRVLGCLSTFRGGFQRQAAEEVAGASLSILSSLVTRSLVRRAPSGRYDLHELIRQYAASMLAQDAGVQGSARDRHSQYYLDLLESRAGRLQSPQQLKTLDELTTEMDNIRAAWSWAISQHQFAAANRVATTLWYVYELHNWWKEGLEQFGDSAEAIRLCVRDHGMTDDLDRCALNSMLSHSAFFKFRLGDSEEAYQTLSSTGPALRAGPDPSYAVYPLCYLGIVCWEQGRFPEANQSLQYSVELAGLYKERWCEGSANEFLGIILHEQGRYAGARTHLMEALSIARGLGDPLLIAHVLSYLGRTTQMLGEYAEAEKQLRESIDVARGISYRSGIGLGLDALALLMNVQGKYGEARAHFQESVNLFREVGDRYREARVRNHQGTNFMALELDSEAREAFRHALAICHERGYIPSTLDALMGLARLAARQNCNREALELAIYVQQHPVSTEEAKDAAASLRMELESRFSGEDVEAAVRSASTRNLDEFVSKFLSPPSP
ncbi:MAG TPA: tetratricopeptide repeat protein, partial [Anaerolineales bacterium]